jgi:RHS repeat-associated protein
MKFTGHERDLASAGGAGDDLDYMHARHCSPLIGRFLSVDPQTPKGVMGRPQRWNRYAYVTANPLRYVDPDGKDLELAVRNNAGGGLTNFGHVALRVVGQGYDVTYDFGRYGRTWGLLKSKGEGVLRVWNSWNAFVRRQLPSGQVRTLRYTTSQAQDFAAIAHFQKLIDEGAPRDFTKFFEEYTLAGEYDLKNNNCTTVCIDALEGAEETTGQNLPGLETLAAENDPRSLFDTIGQLEEDWSERSDPLARFFKYSH